jgi:hypothetical protein
MLGTAMITFQSLRQYQVELGEVGLRTASKSIFNLAQPRGEEG